MELKNKQALFEAAKDDLFNTDDLFAIQGGEDEDLDEDCYTASCVTATNYCVNGKCVIFY